MTPDQFKAWFEGFCEAVDTAPTPEQWAKIKAKVAEIREKPAVTLRDTDFARRWADTTLQNDVERTGPLIVRGVGPGVGRVDFAVDLSKLPDQGERVAKAAGLEPEFGGTRIVDRVSGADLGRAD